MFAVLVESSGLRVKDVIYVPAHGPRVHVLIPFTKPIIQPQRRPSDTSELMTTLKERCSV